MGQRLACSLFVFGDECNCISLAPGNSPSYIPFMFHVNASLSFCPSISMSSLIGTRTSGWDAFSWMTAGSWSSKLEQRATVQHMEQKMIHLACIERRCFLLLPIPILQLPSYWTHSSTQSYRAMATTSLLEQPPAVCHVGNCFHFFEEGSCLTTEGMSSSCPCPCDFC